MRQGPTHLTPARERVASSADLSAPRMAPLGAETQRKPVNATASCRETATRSASGPADEDYRVRSGHARLPEPWRHQIEGWSAAGALAGGGGSSGVAGARGGVNVLHAPRRPGPGASAPLRRPARACGALRNNVVKTSHLRRFSPTPACNIRTSPPETPRAGRGRIQIRKLPKEPNQKAIHTRYALGVCRVSSPHSHPSSPW